MRFLLIFFMLGYCLAGNAQSQEFGFSVSYQYLYAKEWNKAVQTYNFSRPFLTEKQPLLKHGIRLGAYYLFDTSKPFAWGPSVSISFHQSAADNNNFNINIQSFLLDLGMKLQYRPKLGDTSPLHMGITPHLTGLGLYRKLDGDVIIIEDDEEEEMPVRALGMGFGFNFQLGYDLNMGKSLIISPLFGMDYSPLVWSNRSDVVFNEASVGDLKSSTSMIRWQLGLLMRMKPQQKVYISP